VDRRRRFADPETGKLLDAVANAPDLDPDLFVVFHRRDILPSPGPPDWPFSCLFR
jgi:hypothetical protein